MNNRDNNSLFELLAKKISNHASQAEKEELELLLKNSNITRDAVNDLENIWVQNFFKQGNNEIVGQQELANRIWANSFSKRVNGLGQKISISLISRIAATLMILFIFGVLAKNLYKRESINRSEVSWITKETLSGQKSTITLSDGTVVWLNSGSRISFPSHYNDNIREIHLDGQAYFEVFKDAHKPFRVYCRDIVVEALGTSFDINGYTDLPMQVSLVTGSVKVSANGSDSENIEELVLQPGEYSKYDHTDKFIKRGKFDPNYLLAWKEGKIIFKNATIDIIIARLELWYGVKIENNAIIPPNKPFTGVFVQENLENILINIGEVMDFKYEIKGNHVTIKNSMPM